MKSVLSQIRRRHNTGRRFLKKREDESGLTTLEWLLIVAAVAGLAALAVVLVQNVVTETAEQISSSSARVTAAQLAGEELITKSLVTKQGAVSDKYGEWAAYYNLKCERFKITYGDAGITVAANFTLKNNTADFLDTDVTTANITAGSATAEIPTPIDSATPDAVAECRIAG